MSAAAHSRDAKVHKKTEIPADAAQKLRHIARPPLQPRLMLPKTGKISPCRNHIFIHALGGVRRF